MNISKTKRTLIALGALVFSLTGCGNNTNSSVSSAADSTSTAPSSQTISSIDDSHSAIISSSADDPTPAPTPKATGSIFEGDTSKKAVGSGNLSAKGKFYADFSSRKEELEAGRELATQIAEEGDVLLKNADDCLPLSSSETKVTLFGMATVHLVEAGGGSGAGTYENTSGYAGVEVEPSTVKSAMEDAGFKVNPSTVNLYDKFEALGTLFNELPVDQYSSTVTSTYRSYNDAAVVTFDRVGSENIDLRCSNITDHADKSEHYLQLDDNEKDLIHHVKQHFKKVIVLINSANIMEVDDLAAEKTAENLGVDAILWVGTTGNNCIDAVGRILNGSVCPSGHTVDLWSKDFKKDPSFSNFGDQTHNNTDAFLYTQKGEKTKYSEVEYREDIYNGYKYYETVAAEKNSHSMDGEKWYQDSVLYPFGYGLSYTTFDWEFAQDYKQDEVLTRYQTEINVQVKVTNTGKVAGKDVVQAYYTAPYTDGGIEKAATNFVAFEKTDLLQPGESQILTLSFVAQDMASYDYDDANGDDFKGYELDAGDYQVTINRDSHTPVLSTSFKVNETIKVETDYATGNKMDPVYTDRFDSTNDSLMLHKLSRSDLKDAVLPEVATVEDRKISDEIKNRLDNQDTYDISRDTEEDPWYVSSVPTGWTQADPNTRGEAELLLADMAGVDHDDEQWQKFMNQLSWDEMCDMVRNGTGAVAIPYVGKAADTSSDGPIEVKGGTMFGGAPITAATYNKKLSYEMGRMVANDCIFNGITEWLGCGCDIHRSPFGGRNFEYFSEDGMLSGLICEQVVKGATDKGIICQLKHFFANEQETYRADNGGVCTFATEQALREIYAKPFERAVKFGGTMGIMSSFNRIGYEVTSGSYATCKSLLRKDFGFQGSVVGDAWTNDYAPVNMYVRGGTDQLLGTGSSYPKNDLTWDVDYKSNPTQWYNVRTAAQNILFARANSTANKNCYKSVALDDIYIRRGTPDSQLLTLNGSSDIEVSAIEGLPEGLELSAGSITGKTTVNNGTYPATVTMRVDGWVDLSATVNVHVVSALEINSNKVESGVYNYKNGDAVALDVSSEYYAYGNVVEAPYSDKVDYRICNYYEDSDGEVWNRDEDKTAADIITKAYDDESIVKKYEYSYSAEGLPEGLTLTNTTGTVDGAALGQSYEAVTGASITGTAKTGTYTVTITANIPVVAHIGAYFAPHLSWFPYMAGFDTPRVQMISYSETIQIVVA